MGPHGESSLLGREIVEEDCDQEGGLATRPAPHAPDREQVVLFGWAGDGRRLAQVVADRRTGP
jgi:hypothetical protein